MAATWLIVPLGVVIVEARLDGFWIVPVEALSALVWDVVALLSAVWAAGCLRRRALVSGLAYSVLPALLVTSIVQHSEPSLGSGLIFGPLAVLEPAREAGDIAHFVMLKPSYDRQIAALPNHGSRFAEFNWGGMLFASSGVVYDETDQIMLPKQRRSAAWIARMRPTDVMCGGDDLVSVPRPLWSHYYLAGFGC